MNWKDISLIAVVALILSAGNCKKDVSEEVRLDSDHFTVVAIIPESSMGEVEEVLTHAQDLLTKFAGLLQERFDSTQKIVIRLEGPFVEQGPYFDPEGIHLFRYTPEENGYLALLAHELGHAVRESYYIQYSSWNWKVFPYYDEGFAEYLAQLVEPTKSGFPFYGYHEDVVVGVILSEEKNLAQQLIREQHNQFNDSCNIQTYSMRSSWFRYVHHTYGWESLMSLVYTVEEPIDDYVESVLGDKLSAVDAGWRSWAIQQYQEYPGSNLLAEQFRERINWYTFCEG